LHAFSNHARGVGKAGLLNPENSRGAGTARRNQVSNEEALLGSNVNAWQALRLNNALGHISGQQSGANRDIDTLATFNAGGEGLERFALDDGCAQAITRLCSALRRQAGEFLFHLAQLGLELLFGLGQRVEFQRQLIDGSLGFGGQGASLLGFAQRIFGLAAEFASGFGQLGGHVLEQFGCIGHGSNSRYC